MCIRDRIRDGYEIMVKNTQEATKLIVEHQELFRDYEVVKGGMDDVFLAVTGNRMGGCLFFPKRQAVFCAKLHHPTLKV